MTDKKLHNTLIYSIVIILLWSVINPHDMFTWFLEVLPTVIGIIVIVYYYKSFKMTNLSYILLWIHGVILIIGGHYTYAEMPIFNWLKDALDLSRNYYDRLGHFAQGFIPAIVAREILIRKSPLKKGKWLFFLVMCFCLALSAFYELIEFIVALATGEAADAFLGTQGDIWDTQWDMMFALIGALTSLLTLSRLHDTHLKKVN